jgi:hypothetical protein
MSASLVIYHCLNSGSIGFVVKFGLVWSSMVHCELQHVAERRQDHGQVSALGLKKHWKK